jgi:hypothetical protein
LRQLGSDSRLASTSLQHLWFQHHFPSTSSSFKV